MRHMYLIFAKDSHRRAPNSEFCNYFCEQIFVLQNRHITLFAFVGLLQAFAATAQDTTAILQGFGVETSYLAGKIVRHSREFTSPIPALSTAIDVNLLWKTYGKRPWHQGRNYPVVGLGMTYTNYGDNAIYGHCISLYPSLQLPIKRGKNWEWTLRIGNGIAYVTRKHEKSPTGDTINKAISTHINDFAILMTDFRYRCNNQWELQIGGNFTHISNALFREPNLGINTLGAHISARYFPVSSRPKHILRKMAPLPNRWLAQARISMAYNEARPPGNPVLPTYLTTIYASKRYRGKNKLLLGTDFSYSKPTYAFLQWCNLYPGTEWQHCWYGAVFAGTEFLFGRVGIVTQVGVYYQSTYLKREPFYEKIGGHLYLLKQEKGLVKEVYISALLKAHIAVAEFAEFGLGVGL